MNSWCVTVARSLLCFSFRRLVYSYIRDLKNPMYSSKLTGSSRNVPACVVSSSVWAGRRLSKLLAANGHMSREVLAPMQMPIVTTDAKSKRDRNKFCWASPMSPCPNHLSHRERFLPGPAPLRGNRQRFSPPAPPGRRAACKSPASSSEQRISLNVSSSAETRLSASNPSDTTQIVNIYIYICMYVCMCVCMYVSMYVCMYVYIYYSIISYELKN